MSAKRINYALTITEVLSALNEQMANVKKIFAEMSADISNVGDNPKITKLSSGSYSINFSDISSDSLDPFTYDWAAQEKFIGNLLKSAVNDPAKASSIIELILEGKRVRDKSKVYSFDPKFVALITVPLSNAKRLTEELSEILSSSKQPKPKRIRL